MLYIQNTIFLPSEHLRCMTVEVCSELDIFLQTTSQLLDIVFIIDVGVVCSWKVLYRKIEIGKLS